MLAGLPTLRGRGELTYVYSFNSPIGYLTFASTGHGLLLLKARKRIEDIIYELRARGFKVYNKFTPLIEEAKHQVSEYFASRRREFKLQLDMRGTDFQVKVWREVGKIPYGETMSYQEVAQRIGHLNAYRAVGNTLRANPLLIIIPCHRVVKKGGELGNYGLGRDVKRYLLQLENDAKT